MRTPDAELHNYVMLARSDGFGYPVHSDDIVLLRSAPPGVVDLRSIDGFIVSVVKCDDGAIYIPNNSYRGTERREAVLINERPSP